MESKIYGSDFVNQPVQTNRLYGPQEETEDKSNIGQSNRTNCGKENEKDVIEEIQSEFGIYPGNERFIAGLDFEGRNCRATSVA